MNHKDPKDTNFHKDILRATWCPLGLRGSYSLTSMQKRSIIFLAFILMSLPSFSQGRFSLASDLAVQHNFKGQQRFWAIGHTSNIILHLSETDGVYASFVYFSNGEFTNRLSAVAKSPGTIPQQINYRSDVQMRLKQFSLGWKRYLVGATKADADRDWNLYAGVGFGVVLGRVINQLSVSPDTALYTIPVRGGKANFKRLTLDLSLGVEFPLSTDVYLYSEGRCWIPTTDYPSKHILVNENAPFVAILGLGVRVLF